MRKLLVIALATLSLPALAQDDPVGVESTVARTPSVSPEEMLTFSRDANDEVNAIHKTLGRLFESVDASEVEARDCVKNNQIAVKSLLDVSGQAEDKVEGALAAGQTERAEHEFRKVAIALKRSRSLLAEAERCALGGGAQDGKTEVQVAGAEEGAEEDTRAISTDLMDYGLDPTDGSPF